MRRVLLLIAATATLCAGCGGGGGSEPEPALDLAGTSWMLAGGGEVTPTIQFTAKGVSGSGGCNGFGGDYKVEGSKIHFGALVSTQMACVGPADAVERHFLAALEAVARGRQTDGGLVLEDEAGKALLHFHPSSPEGSWDVTSFLQGEAVSSPLPGTHLTLKLADGSLSGSAGCNAYHGSYATEGGAISIGTIAATKKLCAAPAP